MGFDESRKEGVGCRRECARGFEESRVGARGGVARGRGVAGL